MKKIILISLIIIIIFSLILFVLSGLIYQINYRLNTIEESEGKKEAVYPSAKYQLLIATQAECLKKPENKFTFWEDNSYLGFNCVYKITNLTDTKLLGN